MKKTFYVMAMCATVACAASACAGEEEKHIVIPALEAPGTYLLPSADGGKFSLAIKTNQPWTAALESSAAGWLTVSPTSGVGEDIWSGYSKVYDLSIDSLTFTATKIPYTATDTLGRTATLTITAGELTKTILIQQSAGVVLHGITWARTNVDEPETFAATPDAYGKQYQFNQKIAYTIADPVTPQWRTVLNPENNTDWLPQNDPCPQGWRLPTYQEIGLLLDINYVDPSYQEANAVGNPVKGMFYGRHHTTGKATWSDFNGSIFLPSVPYRHSDGIINSNFVESVYWTGEQSNDAFAYCMHKRRSFYSYEEYYWKSVVISQTDLGHKMSGACVRCVKDE
jgi:uncharacterized protein (TIGR02145 family)